VQVITQRRGGGVVKKPFAWSYSKIKNYETCPKRHYHIDVAKDVKETESDQLRFGNALHAALAERCDPTKNKPLPTPFAKYDDWAKWAIGDGSGQILVEQKLAIRRDFAPTGYFDKDVWYRGVADVAKIFGPVALAIDWKTGKIVEDSVQLALMAQCLFSHHPEVQKIRTEFVWLAEDATTRADFTRDDMIELWAGMLPRVGALEHAYEVSEYPAKEGGLCKRWCPVTQCVHNGANQ
jgi:hypothetical protein